MKTSRLNPAEIHRRWFLVDAGGKTLGRCASRIARLLQGKHNPCYTPGSDCGDIVVVLNASRIHVTGDKMSSKTYFRYSGYPGGDKLIALKDLMVKKPTEALRHAIAGMLPHTRLRARMLRRLKIYPADTHPHHAQQPLSMEV